MLDFIRLAAASPKLKVADCGYNADQIIKCIEIAESSKVQILLFPELCITGYSCGDLFRQKVLINAAENTFLSIMSKTAVWDGIIVAGCPVEADGSLYNCAVVSQSGRILGIVPKTHLPGNNEFYEPRWFRSANDAIAEYADFAGQRVLFGSDILFAAEGRSDLVMSVEICEDLWAPLPPSGFAARAGATLILNPSASNELIGKADFRRSLIANQSARCLCAYAYASAGDGESTTDSVYGGHKVIAEGGRIIAESARFEKKTELLIADIDTSRMVHDRQNSSAFHQPLASVSGKAAWRRVAMQTPGGPFEQNTGHDLGERSLYRKVSRLPFVPADLSTRAERCSEIIEMQTVGLAKRLLHTGLQKLVVAVSGGLDSTLALLVASRVLARLELPRSNLIGVTMPGFGTTVRTYDNALALMQGLGCEIREIPIVEATLMQFRDIGHNPDVHDVTYENVQARHRTQIAMNLANSVKGIMVGTGDMSELALGWCTYAGDHMSMYSVNSGVPKTLVRYLVSWCAENGADGADEAASRTLADILDTPISPELLPADSSGQIKQKTEETIGPYELHDFFLYHTLRYAAQPSKVLDLACYAFSGVYGKEEIAKWLTLFLQRFFIHQFKRSCLPDGPKIGTIGLSPRADWRMPSDASAAVWLSDLDAKPDDKSTKA